MSVIIRMNLVLNISGKVTVTRSPPATFPLNYKRKNKQVFVLVRMISSEATLKTLDTIGSCHYFTWCISTYAEKNKPVKI